jgi:1-acyl-sn-glycerol-3-phosphate acyltransferase
MRSLNKEKTGMHRTGYHLLLLTRLNRTILRPVFRLLFHLLSRVEVFGKENVPSKGPYLIAINHVSLFEPPLVIAFWPVAPEAAGAVDIWERRGQSVLVRLYGGIRVHRGEYDRELIETLLSVLRSGYPLLIAPEGGRSHALGMRRALPGAAYLAEKTGVPIIPVGIIGTSDHFLSDTLAGHRQLLVINIGKPFFLITGSDQVSDRHKQRQTNADLIMLKIAELLPAEYHGVYAKDTCDKDAIMDAKR